jgi:hypothetical protein
VTCGASRVISGAGAGEACEALSRCVGGAPCLRFCPFMTPFHFTRTPTTRYIFYLTRLGPSLCASGYVAGLLRVQGCSQLVPCRLYPCRSPPHATNCKIFHCHRTRDLPSICTIQTDCCPNLSKGRHKCCGTAYCLPSSPSVTHV